MLPRNIVADTPETDEVAKGFCAEPKAMVGKVYVVAFLVTERGEGGNCRHIVSSRLDECLGGEVRDDSVADEPRPVDKAQTPPHFNDLGRWSRSKLFTDEPGPSRAKGRVLR